MSLFWTGGRTGEGFLNIENSFATTLEIETFFSLHPSSCSSSCCHISAANWCTDYRARVPGEMLQSVDFMNIHNISVIQGTSDYQHQPFGFLHKEKYNDIE